MQCGGHIMINSIQFNFNNSICKQRISFNDCPSIDYAVSEIMKLNLPDSWKLEYVNVNNKRHAFWPLSSSESTVNKLAYMKRYI